MSYPGQSIDKPELSPDPMGSYLSKPVTKKVSECGEFSKCNRIVIYGATATQGWRVGMEVSEVLKGRSSSPIDSYILYRVCNN